MKTTLMTRLTWPACALAWLLTVPLLTDSAALAAWSGAIGTLAVFLAACRERLAWRRSASPRVDVSQPCAAVRGMETLDTEIAQQLDRAVNLSERSAMDMVRRVAGLHAASGQFMTYLQEADSHNQAMQSDIERNTHIIDELDAFVRRPGLLKLVQKIAERHLAHGVADPALRAKLTPDYRIGCKRILLSNTYYPALAAANADVVASRLAEVRGSTLVGADGSEHEADAIVFGTGFHVTDMPIARRVFGARWRQRK